MLNVETENLIRVVCGITNCLHSDIADTTDLCRILQIELMQARVTDVAIFETSPDAKMLITGFFGPSFGKTISHQSYPLDENSPMGAAIIRKKTIWLLNGAQFHAEFPNSEPLFDVEQTGSLVAVPIQLLGRTIGCLVVEGKERQSDPITIVTLELLASLVARSLKSNSTHGELLGQSKNQLLGMPLTARERLIQEMMSLGLSNKECSVNLGYSESTIRQDAVSLFSKLDVTNRKEAGALFKN